MRLLTVRKTCVCAAMLWAVPLVPGRAEDPSLPAAGVEALRSELDDLHVLRDYRAGKTSFVLNLETICNKPPMLKEGDRKTVLQVTGCGSLRHIWETHGPGEAPFVVEVFIDGEREPRIHGRLADIIRAAQGCEQPFVANAGGFIPKNSNNLYLPIPFQKSIRVDVVLTRKPGLIFMQLDYRVEDESMKQIELHQTGKGTAMKLTYLWPEGRMSVRPLESGPCLRRELKFRGNGKDRLLGPGIIRMLKMNQAERGARLRVRFDGAATPAVDVDLGDFYGPFAGVAFDRNACYLPMPFARTAEFEIAGSATETERCLEVDVEPVQSFRPSWGYFHAKWNRETSTTGYSPFRVLYTRGRGHWLGMSLYDTHHDHGGGDFAVIDGETGNPGFLHGINGEDYFSFAFFGQGKNFPYSEAFDNDKGRMRLHLENVYPFDQSIEVSWGTVRGISPRAVSFWYQDSPDDLTEMVDVPGSLEWEVFGPRLVPLMDDGNTPNTSDEEALFASLPAESELDAGRTLEVERFFRERLIGRLDGWASQRAVGPHLNLMYIYRHSDMPGDPHMGYDARCMMARTTLVSGEGQTVTFQLSYDDPLVVELNGKRAYSDLSLREGFVTRTFEGRLAAGRNSLLVRMLDTPNTNTCWAGIGLRVLDEQGRDVSGELAFSAGVEHGGS